ALACSIDNGYDRVGARVRVARAMARAGEFEHAEILAIDRAVNDKYSITAHVQQMAMADVAVAMAKAGRYDRAETLADSLSDLESRVRGLVGVATALSAAGDDNRATEVCLRAEAVADTLS